MCEPNPWRADFTVVWKRHLRTTVLYGGQVGQANRGIQPTALRRSADSEGIEFKALRWGRVQNTATTNR